MKKENKEPRDENGKRHGLWELYNYNGKLYSKGYYVHGIPHGYFKWYDWGELAFKTYNIR